MKLINVSISIKLQPDFFSKAFKRKPRVALAHSGSLSLAQTLQSESLKVLEWGSVCKQLSCFTSTSMGLYVARNAEIPFGKSPEESQTLLDQTTAAAAAMAVVSRPLDFSGIEDLSAILNCAVSGELLTVRELCTVRRTLTGARALKEKLEDADCSERWSSLVEVLGKCNFQLELEQKIEFCIDGNLLIILDRASDSLVKIRSERKRNMENLNSLLRDISVQVFRAGGIDRPLITRRRSRVCVGIRASHRYLLSDGIILDVSSSGATYFIEPKEAVPLNNMEVRHFNAEKAEERAILSLLTSEIADSATEIKYLLDRILDIDLAFARAAYGRRMNGVCPIFSSDACKGLDNGTADFLLSIDVEGIRHPLLLEHSLASQLDAFTLSSENSVNLNEENGLVDSEGLSDKMSDLPMPIDIKIGCETKVVVISGPNTGGKTASMKTLGLASLMSKAGMYLPAKNRPRLPWFNLVLADIGDSQSLEQSLSTFSGHILRICRILEAASKESLVLVDELGSGTDPAEGVALSTSILQYLVDRVNLAVVTTHYTDLSKLKDTDNRFENAAMEFSEESLQPTYRVLWGSTGDSNALNVAKSVGFDKKIIKRAERWVEQLMPEKQKERSGLLYQSLMEERGRLEAQSMRAASIHAEVMALFHEIQIEAEDLDLREAALRAKETQLTSRELKSAKSQMEAVIRDFEAQLKSVDADQYSVLLKKSQSAIASIVEAHSPSDGFFLSETKESSYTPQIGEQVHMKKLGDKLATVLEEPGDDETVLVQYGKIRVRVKKSDIKALSSNQRNTSRSVPLKKEQGSKRELQKPSEENTGEVSYGPLVQTSKNTVDLRGMRVEEASHYLDMAISARGSNSVLFVIHGMGTGVVKERVLEILRSHPRVARYEQEGPMNYGCTVAYIN